MRRTIFGTKPFDFEQHPMATAPVKFEPRTGPCMRVIERDDPQHPLNVRAALLAGADLSEAQMFAMMNMSDSQRHKAIWHHARLNIFAIPPFSFGTFLQLKDIGLAYKPENTRFHKLTPQASDLADAVADELVRRHAIHAPIVRHAKGEKTKFATFQCTCGWTCAISNYNVQANASRAYTSHLRSVNTLTNIANSIAASTRRHGAEEG